ncbi:MAG: chloride channel protein [Anaerolineae bacterium]|nr:chloride channel protein [Anaerolineae bacterium]
MMEQKVETKSAISESAAHTDEIKHPLKFLDRFQPPEEAVLIGTALLIGLLTGLGAVAFRYLIQGVGWIGYGWLPGLFARWGMGKWYVVLVPSLGGLIVGLLVYYFAREAKGHGVPEVMEAVALRGGRIRPRVAIIKSLASSISIGSGGSVGREGPIVQIGAALGSSIGQLLHLSDERIRNLVACGAAGGIAATFNAPIAGVIFALEVILGEFSVAYFSTVVISAVSASVIGQAVFGDMPAFEVPMEYSLQSVWEYALYPVLGVLAGLIGVVFVRLLYWSEDRFDDWKHIPEWIKPAVGGALLGGLALSYPILLGINWDTTPQIFNVGYEVIESALANQLPLKVVLALILLKLIATSLTLGSGGSGGIFAPSLFMGAMLGASFGLLMQKLFPGITAPAGAYALVGMAAVFSASAHAPITAVLILFELTGDYRIILPLMLTVVISTLLAGRLLKGESIYTLKLTRRGVRLQRGRDVDVMQSVTVSEIMTRDTPSVLMSTTIVELSEIFSHRRHHGFAVVDDAGKLLGVVTLDDLDRAVAKKLPRQTTAVEIATPRERLLVAYPDESMGAVLSRMGIRGLGRLPVVSREDPGELLGVIRRRDVIQAYHIALTRRAELQHRAARLKLRNLNDTEFIELLLTGESPIIGKMLTEIASCLPEECVLVSIRRGDSVIIPHGDTVFQHNDQVTAFVHSRDAQALKHCVYGQETISA